MNFNVSISDIINFFLVITGIIALRLQSRSVKLSEKELKAKIKDIQQVVEDLEEEKAQRIKQIEQRKVEHFELKNTSFENVRDLSTIISAGDISLYRQLASMNQMFVTISNTLSLLIKDVHKNISEDHIPVISVLDAMIGKNISYIERNNHLISFNETLEKLDDGLKKALLTATNEEECQKIYVLFKYKLDQNSEKFSKKLVQLDKNFKKAYETFNKTTNDLLTKNNL